MSAPDYGSAVFSAWRSEAGATWDDYVRHRFVEQLGDGTLPQDCFLHYLIQDYVFLVHFSRAWALAVVKSESLEEMKTAAATVDALVNHEMQLHVQICREAGISEDEIFNAEEAVENLSYKRYVMDAGFSGDFLDLMAALMPCVFGYGEIGARLMTTAAQDTSYRDWIETYASEDYQGLCRTVAAMLETAAAARLGPVPRESPRWAALSARFRTATRLEVGFWDMGLRGI